MPALHTTIHRFGRQPSARWFAPRWRWLPLLLTLSLLSALTLWASGTAQARVETIQVQAPAAAGGLEAFAVYRKEAGPAVFFTVTIPPNTTAEAKRDKIVDALAAAGFSAIAKPGNQIKVEGIDDLKWNSGTGEVGDAIAGGGPQSAEFGLLVAPGQRAPAGQDSNGAPALYEAAFSGPGFNASAGVLATHPALQPGFGIDDVLGLLYQDLLGDLPDVLKPGLELDLALDLIRFNPNGLPLPQSPALEWALLGSNTDVALQASLRMYSVPLPATAWLVLLAAAGGFRARRPATRNDPDTV